jgi:PAS domain S-box-containing protein
MHQSQTRRMTDRDLSQEDESLEFFELSPDICCILTPKGNIVRVNPATERILGYSSRDLGGMNVLGLVHPKDEERFAKALDELSNEPAPFSQVEIRFRAAGGAYRWLRWNATRQDRRIFATAYDITESRADLERRYHRLFETAKDAIVLVDATNGRLLDLNRRTLELTRFEATELRGLEIWACPPFIPGDIGRQLFDALQSSEVFRSECDLATKAGGTVPCELLCNRYMEGPLDLIQANIRDISDRRRAETALRESEERFRMLVEGVKDYAIFMTDPHGAIVSWNTGAERIIGYKDSEIIGRNAEILFTPEDRERGESAQEFETAVRDGCAEDERWHLRRNGTRFFASGIMTPLWHPDGSLRGFAKIMRDVTERKTNEVAMRETQKLESIGLLAGGIAHDFNNLLTGIIGNASLALDDLSPDAPAKRLIHDVITAGQRAADLTRQLLAYAGKGRFKIETFNISDAVEEILGLIHASISERVQLQLRLDKDLPAIEADPTQIQQVAMNLIINAAEAIDGGGTITISTRREYLDRQRLAGTEGLSQLAPGDYVILQVEDNGSGMHEETKARIFDPFFTTKFTGRGLGLAAVAGIVRAHHGGIHVLTSPGIGSTFRVLLPSAGRSAAPWRGDEPVVEVRGSETILVADDDRLVREISRTALERRGYRVITAEDGQQAVELFQANPGVDLVVLDLAMPVMDGEQACRQIKEIRPEAPILISSGYSELMASSRFGPGGMEGFIQKPYTVTQFTERVQKMLRRRAKQ